MPEWLDPQIFETLRLGLLGRLALATLLGGLVGIEREISGKPAGLRTNILICVGATLIMEVSQLVAGASTPGQPADPGRIAAQVVSGIGFIGAGTILVARGNVIGLTTAATLWVVAAIGLAVGAHAYLEAVGTTVLVVITLVLLGWVEDFLLVRRRLISLELVTDPHAEALDDVAGVFSDHGLTARMTQVEKGTEQYRVLYDIRGPRGARDRALHDVANRSTVRKVSLS